MKILKSLSRLATVITLATTATLVANAEPRSILQLRDTIQDNKIVYPESFETDVHKMMENWYLTHYAILDKQADSRADVPVDDQTLIDRLQKMPVEIEMPFNSIVRSYINMYAERKKGLVENMLGMSLYYMPIFEQALDKYGMPLELRYLPVIESALNPNAVSKAGATGLWQFMMYTGRGLGLEVSDYVDERRDPIASSDAGARYLKQLYDTFGDWSLAIAAYNCGPGNVNKAIRRAGGGKKDFWEIYPFLPAETRGYVPAFIAANYVMNYYDKHNISPALARRPIITDTVHVSRNVHFEQISEVLDIPMDELRLLNPQFRKDYIPGETKPYALTLPNIQAYCYIANEDSIVNHNAEKYRRRPVVEPADGSVKGQDSNGEYVEELVVKYHKVKKNETLASIAKKYGVTTSSIKKTNKVGNKVKRGTTLKINTYRRKYVPSTKVDTTATTADSTIVNKPQVAQPDNTAVATDSVPAATVAAPADKVESTQKVAESKVASAKADTKKTDTTATKKNKKDTKTKAEAKKPKTTSHKVRNGENLTKIAKKYGVTVDQIKKANNLKDDKINIGATIKIPAK